MLEEGELLKAPPDQRIGAVIKDKYKIVKKIGEGGMGAVYSAEHLLIKRKVAIKCLHANFAANEQIVKRFHNEALAATAIGHQNIVDITDMDRFDDGTIFMVLEFLEGQEYGDLLKEEGPQPLPRVVHIVSQVCDALAAAHAKGIVHRDLKPENIFLTKRGNDPDFVKLLDFGIAKFKGGVDGGMTRTGTVMGSPHYMSPEQAKGDKAIDQQADIYSLGIILFHALTGRVPFDADSFPMLVVQICNEAPPSLRMYRPDLPEDLEALVMSMLSKVPRERPGDCVFIKEALLRYAGFPSGITLGESAPNWPGGVGSTPGTYGSSPSLGSSPSMGGASYGGYGSSPSMSSGVSGASIAPEGKSKTTLIAAGIALLLVLLIGGGVIAYASGAFDGDAPAPPPPPPPIAIPTPPPPPTPEKVASVAAATTPPPEKTPAKTETVRVQIETTPDTAELFLDGHRIANPFDADLPQQDEPRVLEAKLAKHTSIRQELSLRFPQRVKLSLVEGTGVDDRRIRRNKTSSSPTREGSAKRPSTPSTPSTPPPSRPTTPVKSTPTTSPAPAKPAGGGLKRIRVFGN